MISGDRELAACIGCAQLMVGSHRNLMYNNGFLFILNSRLPVALVPMLPRKLRVVDQEGARQIAEADENR